MRSRRYPSRVAEDQQPAAPCWLYDDDLGCNKRIASRRIGRRVSPAADSGITGSAPRHPDQHPVPHPDLPQAAAPPPPAPPARHGHQAAGHRPARWPRRSHQPPPLRRCGRRRDPAPARPGNLSRAGISVPGAAKGRSGPARHAGLVDDEIGVAVVTASIPGRAGGYQVPGPLHALRVPPAVLGGQGAGPASEAVELPVLHVGGFVDGYGQAWYRTAAMPCSGTHCTSPSWMSSFHCEASYASRASPNRWTTPNRAIVPSIASGRTAKSAPESNARRGNGAGPRRRSVSRYGPAPSRSGFPRRRCHLPGFPGAWAWLPFAAAVPGGRVSARISGSGQVSLYGGRRRALGCGRASCISPGCWQPRDAGFAAGDSRRGIRRGTVFACPVSCPAPAAKPKAGPVTVTRQPVTRCDLCGNPVTYEAGKASRC